jgi:hypothetical protein
MGAFLMDANDKWLGDISFGAVSKLAKGAPPAIKKFLHDGEADAALLPRVIEEAAQSPRHKFLARYLKNAVPPVIITQ